MSAVVSGSEHVISLRDVTRTYGSELKALDKVSIDIRCDEFVAIVGPSGSGKTTLLNIVGTLDRANAGQVVIDGRDVAALSDDELSALRAHRIGFVFQHFHLAHGVSALDNVADGMLYTGIALRERRERAESALARVGLAARLAHRPHELSGGEKQRVAIARAVARGPALLLADEPTGALDTRTGASVMELLFALHEAGTAVVVITHDLSIAAQCRRQVNMRDGCIVADQSGLRT
ncbi:MAG TPA: ABC transporter ATP-binding protein [Hyphomicrobiales bacterium]|nr:ABC transporter ATP-binding protein [Hyphomicrobiales bacterium]